jgi:Flp pilus assembly protein TadD
MIDDFDGDDNSDDQTASGYIACRACGARIRANREQCLRCGEPLAPAPETVSLSTISSGRPLLITIGITAAVVAVLVFLWMNRPSPADSDAQSFAAPHPATTANAAAPADRRGIQPNAAASAGAIQGAGADAFIDATGVAALPEGDPPTARARFEQAVAQNPADPEAFNNLGRALVWVGDRKAAVDKFARAVELGPSTWSYHFNQAYMLGELREWERALSEYRVAAQLAPDQYAVQFDLAMALHKSGDDASAIPQYQLALRLAPADPRVHAALATSLEREGRATEARKAFQRYLELAPSAPDAEAVKAHLQTLGSSGSVSGP